jgi:CRP-like cAMP-binding protein
MPRCATSLSERPIEIDPATGTPFAELERLCRLLARAPLFNGLACEDIARFARGVREIRIARGEILFHRGDPCNGFHLILDGQIKLAFTSAEGNEKVVDILYAGRSFGEAVMFMEKPYVVMAQALTDATLLHIGKQVFFEEMAGDTVFCRKIIAGLAQRLHLLMADVESYSLRSGRDRVVGYLLREEERDGDAVAEGQVSIRLPTSKGTIASRLNLTQEHFSRILSELTSAGLIQVEGRVIHIPDIGRLRKSLG